MKNFGGLDFVGGFLLILGVFLSFYNRDEFIWRSLNPETPLNTAMNCTTLTVLNHCCPFEWYPCLRRVYRMITNHVFALWLNDRNIFILRYFLSSVRPPKKSWKNISNLSGGEKTLSSLALVFALHHYKPTPLYVMDEIDAALDFKNVSIVANYIRVSELCPGNQAISK